MGMARRLLASSGSRAAGGLRPPDVPRITLLGAHPGPQTADPRARKRRLRARPKRSPMDLQDRAARVAATILARHAPQHADGHAGRRLGPRLLQHRRYVDAVIPGAAARLVDCRIWQLLYLVGVVRDNRVLGGRLDDRSA